MENEQKTQKKVVLDHKKMIISIIISFGVAVGMVLIFGKLAPIGIVSYRLVSQIIKPLL